MTTSLEIDTSDIVRLAIELTGERIVLCRTLSGGKNSRVQAVVTDSAKHYVVKQYFPRAGRDSQRNEYDALHWLNAQGVTCVAKPLAMQAGATLFEYVEGQPGPPAVYTEEAANQVVDFVANLQRISRNSPSWTGIASEAALSAAEVVAHIRVRADRLLHAAVVEQNTARDQLFAEMRGYVSTKLLPAVSAWQVRFGPAYVGQVRSEARMLSPSDFGLHNAILRNDNIWIFIDFEHFGWDDPAKLVGDFLLHPAMPEAESWKLTVARRCIELLVDGDELKRRAQQFLPLLALKWSLILLNEFLPQDAARRTFSLGEHSGRDAILYRQLGLSKSMYELATTVHWELAGGIE
jgi:hypothetical protein